MSFVRVLCFSGRYGSGAYYMFWAGSTVQWTVPPTGFFKINFDGAFRSGESVGGVGVVVRDTEGMVQGAMQLRIGGDAINVISALRHVVRGHLVIEGRELFRDFQACHMLHVRRMANTAAHTLAQEALNGGADLYWVEECPLIIRDYVEADMFSF
ncbi:hypothetical protein PTKIN_Ptkin14bG0057300 [Pterospermum kingtungense]